KATNIYSNYKFINALNQKVLQRTITDSLGNTQIITHDALDRVVLLIKKDPSGKSIYSEETFYDLAGNKSKIVIHDLILKKDQETRWVYGPMNRLEKLIEGPSSEEMTTTFTYNQLGQLILQQNSKCKFPIKFFYGVNSLVDKIVFYDEEGIEHIKRYKYDEVGHVTEATLDQSITIKRLYTKNLLELETIEDRFGTYDVFYGYDLQGKVKWVTLPDKSYIYYHYLGNFAYQVGKYDAADKCKYFHTYTSYDQSGNILEEKLIKSLGVRKYSYDLCQRKEHVETAFYSETAQFDAIGQVIGKKTKDLLKSSDITYGYNSLSQLTKENGSQGEHDYSFDAFYNFIKLDDQKISNNNLNQCLTSPQATYTYNSLGVVSSKTENKNKITFHSDNLNQITSIDLAKNKKVIFSYDPLDRRICKEVKDKNTTKVSRYIYLKDLEIGALDEKGKIFELKVPGLHGKGVAFELESEVYLPIYDLQDNVIQLVASDGSISESYTYSAFGKEEIFDDEQEKIDHSLLHNPWRYASKRTDEETNLIFFGRRFLDPSIGKWLTPDPLGYQDGPNRYAYVRNNPMMFFDRLGLSCQDHYAKAKDFNQFFYWGRHDPKNSQNQSVSIFLVESAYNESTMSCLGLPDLENGMMGFTNGMRTTFDEARHHALILSNFANGKDVKFLYNASNGFVSDLYEAVKHRCGSTSIEEEDITNLWKNFIQVEQYLASVKDNYQQNGILWHCHSAGAAITKNALLALSEEEQQYITVVAIAPSEVIPSEICKKAYNYVSKRDFVTSLSDSNGMKKYAEDVYVLEPHENAPFWDHDFESPTYTDVIYGHIKDYLENPRK
ncbi:MAG: RHS repeat-associated core domain-containing protein, partial [Chlamydiae bacterium]|nr:RHS repeat-associated core domain-containing protein [Chlamydiota bacterium]